MIAVREFTTAAEVFANAKAVRAKFFPVKHNAPPEIVRKADNTNHSTPMRNGPRRLCEWEKRDIHFDEHVTAHRIGKRIQSFVDFVPDGKPRTAHGVALEVLSDFPQYTLEDMKGERGNRERSAVRRLAIYSVHIYCPHMSLRAIGSYFGGREQTTIVAAIQRMERLMKHGARDIKQRMSEADKARSFELWVSGTSVRDIAKDVGVSREAIYDLSYRLNWPKRGTSNGE